MSLFTPNTTPIFLKEDSDTSQQIARLKELHEQATGKLKDDIARELSLVSYGEVGEKNIAFELKNSGMPMVIIHDLRLEFEELSAQIDYVVVTRKLIFFIECKNLYGNIDIDDQGNFVRSYPWNGRTVKEGIYSPITQNQRHLEVLKQIGRSNRNNALTKTLYDKSFEDFHKSVVVLANPKTVLNAKSAPKEVKDQVIRADQLIAYLKNAEKRSKEMGSNDKRMRSLAEGLLTLHRPIQTDYVQKFEDLISQQTATIIKAEPVQPLAAAKQPAIEPVVEPLPLAALAANDELVSKLKDFRLKQSRAENIKAYCVFTDKQMQDLLNKMPKTADELLGVTGFGPVKVEKYGAAIIDLLK
ncbi:NERD domain-containing protein [Acetobacterium wieringae]|uniref:NERD domain-containing protein n=1 Tax=Acetobacterium wieringae TaxID=52694 RepID=UPI0026ED777E|nr:NERD domain-containing protein [Acetobacterium wieringae]